MAYANRYKSAQPRSGVFISYARSDGEAFAHRLREHLEKQNIKLWQDRVALEGGRDWWLQITEALDNRDCWQSAFRSSILPLPGASRILQQTSHTTGFTNCQIINEADYGCT